MIKDLSRSDFLKLSGLAAGGLALSVFLEACTSGQSTSTISPTKEPTKVVPGATPIEPNIQVSPEPTVVVKPGSGGPFSEVQINLVENSPELAKWKVAIKERWSYWAGADVPAVSNTWITNGEIPTIPVFDPNDPENASKAWMYVDIPYNDGSRWGDCFSLPWINGAFQMVRPADYPTNSNGQTVIETGQGINLFKKSGVDSQGRYWYLSSDAGLPVRRMVDLNIVLQRLDMNGYWVEAMDPKLNEPLSRVLEGASFLSANAAIGDQVELGFGMEGFMFANFLDALAKSKINADFMVALLGKNKPDGKLLLEYLRSHGYELPFEINGYKLKVWNGEKMSVKGIQAVDANTIFPKILRLDSLGIAGFGFSQWSSGVKEMIEPMPKAVIWSGNGAELQLGLGQDGDGRVSLLFGNNIPDSEQDFNDNGLFDNQPSKAGLANDCILAWLTVMQYFDPERDSSVTVRSNMGNIGVSYGRVVFNLGIKDPREGVPVKAADYLKDKSGLVMNIMKALAIAVAAIGVLDK